MEIKNISDSEMDMMKIFWKESRPLTISEVLEKAPEKNWKVTTALTFASRLTEKGVLTYEKRGRTNFYSALISEEQYKNSESVSFFKRIKIGSLKSLVSNLCDNELVDENDLNELTQWLNNRKEHDGEVK